MTERKLSKLQEEYKDFFLKKLRLFGVSSPAELSKEEKRLFFTAIKQDWAKIKITRRQNREYSHGTTKVTTKRQKPIIKQKTQEQPKTNDQRQEKLETTQEFTTETIESVPNKEQTDDLKVQFTPNTHFSQVKNYLYPVVKMPKHNNSLKLPRVGRSNQKGYKENDFYNEIKNQINDIELTNNVHMVIPNYNHPYEPDIVLFDKSLNLYIDIEIDEPYDGYYGYPTHCLKQEEVQKQDNIRDLFFTESGWVVIRFTEKQVHLQSNECIDYIKNVLNSIYDRDFNKNPQCEKENQWNENQCIQWQKNRYRENYLNIDRFRKQNSLTEIKIDTEETENIEKVLQRTKRFKFDTWSNNIAFDEETHKYIHPKDETGNAEYISVTTLIGRFFPFDVNRYIERKAVEENRTEEDVLIEYLINRDEAASKGTYMHNQIENYLKGKKFDDDSKEFDLFLKFQNKEIAKRNLVFNTAEKMIYSNKYNVAGTIDCLYKKHDKDEYIMLDWKRSKKLTIDGRPIIYGYGFALSELRNLDNSSYNKYCLQQNIYKHIVESEYSIKISSMKLVVLHENYSNYYVVNVPEMKKETKAILNSLKYKI